MLSNISDNVVKISAAGSGKTWDICCEALELANKGQASLITTYTNRGLESVKDQIRKQNRGVLHSGITIRTWESFLFNEMIKPYQNYVTNEINKIDAIDFNGIYGVTNFQKRGSVQRYLTSDNNVIYNQLAEFAYVLNEKSKEKVIHRLEKIYTHIFIDEIQDLTGYDINLIELLMDSSIGVTCCGDNKQATYSTHNTKKNKNKSGTNIWFFFNAYKKKGQLIFEKKLQSRRFNQQICDFANKIAPAGDLIETVMNEETEHDGVFLISQVDISSYQETFHAQALRYDVRSKDYGLFTINFGKCKGETFERVLIICNGPLKKFLLKQVKLDSPEKYYVAVTRPKYSLAIILDRLPQKVENFCETIIVTKRGPIKAMKFISSFSSTENMNK